MRHGADLEFAEQAAEVVSAMVPPRRAGNTRGDRSATSASESNFIAAPLSGTLWSSAALHPRAGHGPEGVVEVCRQRARVAAALPFMVPRSGIPVSNPTAGIHAIAGMDART